MADMSSPDVNLDTPRSFEARLLHVLSRPLDPADHEIASELQRTLVFDPRALLFGAVSVLLLLGALAVFENLVLSLVLGLLFIGATFARFRAIILAGPDRNDERALRYLVYSGLIYALVISLVGATAAFSGNPGLLAMGALVITGLVFGFCIVNSGTPYFARAQTLIVILPFVTGTGLSGPVEMLLILLQAPIWIIGIFMLIRISHIRLANLIRAQRQNRYLAYNDLLTGLANRAQVMSSLRQIASDRAGHSPPPYVLYLDLDGFKTVNDTYGHAVGDMLLRAVAERLSAQVRAGDIVGRIGGDEFVIILRDLAPGEISLLAERLAQSISQTFKLTPSIEVTIGVSIGGAPLGQNAEDAIAEADTRLYSAKHDGRGTYRLSGI